jgi:hypothetical protein
VGQADWLEKGTAGGEDSNGAVCDEDAFLKIHALKVWAIPSQSLKSSISELRDGSALKGRQPVAVIGQRHQGCVGKMATVGHA